MIKLRNIPFTIWALVLPILSPQELKPIASAQISTQLKNFAKVKVSIGYNSAATSVILIGGDGAKLPSATPYYLVWWNATDYPDPSDDPNKEIVRVTTRSTDTLTIVRGQDGTSAANHNTTFKIYRMVQSATAGLLGQLAGNIANVKYHGAKGDDSTDDTAAFNAAVAALPAGGGTLAIPDGTYRIASSISIAKPLKVTGNGWASILKANNTTLTSIIDLTSGGDGSEFRDFQIQGSKTGAGGGIQRGILINGPDDVLIERVLFTGPNSNTGLNFGVDIVGPNSERNTVQHCYFRRLVDSGGHGTSILIEFSSWNKILYNDLDYSDFVSGSGPGAAIQLTSSMSYATGSGNNTISHNRIYKPQQAGIAIGSTTYSEFQGTSLGANELNVIEDNDISFCDGAGSSPDANSGIVMVGNSNRNRFILNKLSYNGDATNGGHGIIISGAQGTAKTITGATNATPIVITATAHGFNNGDTVGISQVGGNTNANGTRKVKNKATNTFEITDTSNVNIAGNGAYTSGGLVGLAGFPKVDEIPLHNEIDGNSIFYNKWDGIKIRGAKYTTISRNFCYENGQSTDNTYGNITLDYIGGSVNGSDNSILLNYCYGTMPQYQIKVLANVPSTILNGNVCPSTGTGDINDAGSGTIFGWNIQSGILSGGELVATGGYRCTLDGWSATALASQTNVQMGRFSVAAGILTEAIAVRAGSLVGVVVRSDSAQLTGTCTVEVFINGVASGLIAILDGTNRTIKATTQAKDTDAIAVGDTIDVRFTTTAGWTPITAVINCSVEIEQ